MALTQAEKSARWRARMKAKAARVEALEAQLAIRNADDLMIAYRTLSPEERVRFAGNIWWDLVGNGGSIAFTMGDYAHVVDLTNPRIVPAILNKESE
jgi:hypothetical protein